MDGISLRIISNGKDGKAQMVLKEGRHSTTYHTIDGITAGGIDLTGEPDNLMLAKLAGVEAIYGVKLEDPDKAYRKAREAARWAMPLLSPVPLEVT